MSGNPPTRNHPDKLICDFEEKSECTENFQHLKQESWKIVHTGSYDIAPVTDERWEGKNKLHVLFPDAKIKLCMPDYFFGFQN